MGKIKRRPTRVVYVGDVGIGGDNRIVIQSMTNTPTKDVSKTLNQINKLYESGCEIVRVAVPDDDSLYALKDICKNSPIPVVADIHFNYKYAIKAIDFGISKLRINPGNIGEIWKVKEVVKAAKEKRVPIRIGVNAGSLEKDILQKYGHPTPEAMVESALRHVQILEDLDFYDIVISLKASDILTTIEAYKLMARKRDYPLHIGITEAGTIFSGAVRSAVGLGILLYEGIGDTIRVSLTGDPVEEIKTAFLILEGLGLREDFVRVISCPTCARAEINVEDLAKKVENALIGFRKNLHVAVMGCAVNGPGEAREADYGIAGGKGEGLIFKKGKIIGKYKEGELVERLLEVIKKDKDNG